MASASPNAHPLTRRRARAPPGRPGSAGRDWRSDECGGPGGAARRERRCPRSQGRGAALWPRIPRPGASAPALRPGSTGLAAAPREGLPETRTCGASELFFSPFSSLDGAAGQLVAFPLPLSLLFPFLVPSFLSFFSPAAAAPD